MKAAEFSVLGPLMGGFGSQAFLGCVHADGGTIRPAVMVFLPDEIVDNPDLLRRVWQETQLGSEIDHVNVIGVMGLARLDEGYARVVEYADAESLRSVYRRATTLKKAIPPGIAVALVADACMGAHYAHELGLTETGEAMIHGGIRPETIQVSFQGMAKVTGYGATTIAEVARKQRGPDVRDVYTAPEQAYGGRAAATPQTDIYALGCVLYEALTGKPPFGADNELAEAMIKDELARPSLTGVTEAMVRVVLHATRKRSTDRYATALDMRHELLETCDPQDERDVRRFMDELFPPETVPRATRDQMLRVARGAPPAPTGRLLTEFPVELLRATKARGYNPSDAEVEAAQGTNVKGFDEATEPAERVAQALVGRVLSRTGEASDTVPTMTSPGPGSLETTVPGGLVPPGRIKTSPGSPPSWKAQPTVPPEPVEPPAAPTVAAAPPQPPAPAPVVYRTPPQLLLGLGLAGGAAVALAAVLFGRGDPAPVAIAPAPAPVVAPPPAPVEAPPKLEPIASDTPSAQPKKPVPAAAPVPKGPGTLVVTASPDSMAIFVDGKPAGTGSASLELPPGKHKVQGKAAGTTITRTVTLRAGRTENLALEVGRGSLSVEAPDGSTVFIDGKAVGKTPMGPVEVAEGTHKVLVKQGTLTYTQTVPIKADLETFLQVQFHQN